MNASLILLNYSKQRESNGDEYSQPMSHIKGLKPNEFLA